jgi:hypothetical protein
MPDLTPYDILPEHCFISHSYKDAEARALLLKKLPTRVRPFIFPPITVRPDKMVTTALIDAILEKESLIYLEGGYSARSFWVAFERDYALRAGKATFSFEPISGELRPVTTPPLDLPLYASYAVQDRRVVQELLAFMRVERYFEITDYTDQHARMPVPRQVRESIVERLSRGGYIVAFWSKAAVESHHVNFQIEFGMEFSQYFTEGASDSNLGRVLFARLDDTPLPDWWQRKRQENPAAVVEPIQLFEDHGRSSRQRLDDLIVYLYWLIYRNTHNEVDSD